MNATRPAPGSIQAASLDMARSVLMAAGSPLLARGLVTGDQWQAIAGGLLAILSAAWSYVAAHPGRTPPLQALRALIRGGGQAPAWNADVAALEQLLLPIVEQAVDSQIKARAGLLAGPADAIANSALQQGAKQAEQHLQV